MRSERADNRSTCVIESRASVRHRVVQLRTRLLRGRDRHHPRHAEAVNEHAKLTAPLGCRQRHDDVATLGQPAPEALELGLVFAAERHREPADRSDLRAVVFVIVDSGVAPPPRGSCQCVPGGQEQSQDEAEQDVLQDSTEQNATAHDGDEEENTDCACRHVLSVRRGVTHDAGGASVAVPSLNGWLSDRDDLRGGGGALCAARRRHWHR